MKDVFRDTKAERQLGGGLFGSKDMLWNPYSGTHELQEGIEIAIERDMHNNFTTISDCKAVMELIDYPSNSSNVHSNQIYRKNPIRSFFFQYPK